MRQLQAYLRHKQDEFAAHPFFRRLAERQPLEKIQPLIARLAFWVPSFQDVLTINEALIESPEFKEIARSHRREDAGHQVWYLQDLEALEMRPPTMQELFGPAHERARHATFALAAEPFRAPDDLTRIVLLLALESAGHVFFRRIATYFDQSPVDDTKLRYFSRHHIGVEEAHDLFEDPETSALVSSIELSGEQQQAMQRLADRCFAAFRSIFDDVEDLLRARAA